MFNLSFQAQIETICTYIYKRYTDIFLVQRAAEN